MTNILTGRKPANQILLRIGDEIVGKVCIHRGSDGAGYFLSGYDNTLGITIGNFPLTQDEVAREFKEQGKEWKYE